MGATARADGKLSWVAATEAKLDDVCLAQELILKISKVLQDSAFDRKIICSV